MEASTKHTNYVLQEGEFEYKLTMPRYERIWFQVGITDIGILFNAEGVSIDVYKHGADEDGPRDSLWLQWSDYEWEEDEEDEEDEQ